MDTRKKVVGEITLENKVDITDPCYDKDVWCRTTQKCSPGTYKCIVELGDCDSWGERVFSIAITNGRPEPDELEYVAEIGVDAGLAGFFPDKKDYNDKEWEEFCDKTRDGHYWLIDGGFVSSSGYGDGGYEVFGGKNDKGEYDYLKIVFIDKNHEDEED